MRNTRVTIITVAFILLGSLELKAQQLVIQINKPFLSRSLSGIVVDPNGLLMAAVAVDRCSKNWLDRLESTRTNERGEFRFFLMPSGTHYLRIRYLGFQELKIKILVKRKTRKLPIIKMELAT